MNILVTGASGFIGSNLVRKLVEKGHIVTALVNQNNISVTGIKVIKRDISDESLSFEDTYDVTYHLAAVTPLERNKKIQQKINFEGTINLFDKIKHKTKNLVYISGLGIFGDASNQIIDESTKKNPDTDYARIRLAAERYLGKKCEEIAIGFTVAYLGEVYGNGGWFASQVIERLKNGKFKMPKSGEYTRSFVHVDDVSDVLVEIGEKQLVNQSFIVADSHPVLFKDFINYTADKIGVKHPGGIPIFLAKTILGGDFVKLLTTPTKASNKKISEIIKITYPTYKEGLTQVISNISQR